MNLVYHRLTAHRDDAGVAEIDAQLNRPVAGIVLSEAQDRQRVTDEQALFAQTLARFG